MDRNIVETLMGAFVLAVAAAFIVIGYQSGNVGTSGGYLVTAKFREVGSLNLGSDVRVGGIKVGTVAAQRLDPITFQAVVDLNIRNDVKLPKDSTAAVVSDGLLGGKYVMVEPGGEEENLAAGDDIKYTQDAINLETLLGKVAFGGVGGDKKEKPASSLQ